MRKVLTTLALCALTSCGVFDNPQTTPGGPVIPPASEEGVLIILRNFTPYLGKQVDFRLVGGDGTVLTVARTARLSDPNYRLELGAVPQKPDSYVDVLVDADGDGVHSDDEPAWSAPLNDVGSVLFDGSSAPTGAPVPAQPGGEFIMHFTGFGHLDGELLRLALLNPASQITGLYTGTVRGDEFTIELPQVVVDTQPYTIAFFVDANGDGGYDAPPVDAAWLEFATGDPAGISLDFDYHEDFQDVDFER
jgi:hypothetical protein